MTDIAMALEKCQDCGSSEGEMFPFKGQAKGKSYLCLDCAAKFANKKIVQSYIAAAIGLALVIFMIMEQKPAFSESVFQVVAVPYAFWGTFFGWHYGGRIWPKLGEISENWIFGIILLSVRITFAMIAGIFGGGIAQFLTYRKIIKQKETRK